MLGYTTLIVLPSLANMWRFGLGPTREQADQLIVDYVKTGRF